VIRAGALALALLVAATVPAGGAELAEVAPGILVRSGVHEDFTPDNRGGIANLAAIIGGRGVLLVDAGGSYADGRDFVEAVRARTDRPIRWLVLTHVHPDHVFGARAAVEAGAQVIAAHAKLPAALAERGPVYAASMERLLGEVFAGSEPVAPTLTVAAGEERILDLGERQVVVHAWPIAHTDTDLTVYDPTTRTLITGDLLFVDRLPVLDGSLLGWLRVMDALAVIPAVRAVPGHGPVSVPFPDALEPQRRYLTTLRDAVRELIRASVPLSRAPELVPPPSGWLLVEPNHGRNVTAAYAELEWED